MKELAVVSLGENTLNSMMEQLNRYLGDRVQVKGFALEKGMEPDRSCPLILVTSDLVGRMIAKNLSSGQKLIVARRTMSYEFIEPVFSLQETTDILLVNDTEESCTESIAQLKSQGFHSFTFHPYYPGIKEYRTCDVSITPGEPHLVPEGVKQVINIGHRQVDITTITEVMAQLEILEDAGAVASSEFVSEIVHLTRYLSTLNRKLDRSNLLLTTIFDKYSKALMFCDPYGTVTYANEKMKWIFNGEHISDLMGEGTALNQLGEEEIVEIGGNLFIVSVDQVENQEGVICYLVECRNYDSFRRLDTALRSKIQHHRFIPRHVFEDLSSKNPEVTRMIDMAKRMAKSDSTILIQGESGTGKELLAQAIHNGSGRAGQAFVPVNFAALSPSILESELFGYVEGAYTGAKKGGKHGLFEEAHGGTIFMDEIGDAPLSLQVKLLRVLQEGVVRRVGGTELVPIDVRVIAATNINLEEKVAEGSFREDLYYRLNVLPLQTHPLRKRREDITSLLLSYLNVHSEEEHYHLHEVFREEALQFLIHHPWPGNIRELTNVVEYVINIRPPSERIELSELPTYLIREAESRGDSTSALSEEEQVLLTIYHTYGIGRRKMVDQLRQKGMLIGESKVKSIIQELKERGWITIHKGARGCTVTEEGRVEAKKLVSIG
ncbi:hypothetical protein ASG66_14810 [Bacillus sp. Leaf406]|nr:hypothetical protein ASG66_14810 [Bacillus sp. Leaf406]